jgi:tetratricopeptide (TPR) repeat protein
MRKSDLVVLVAMSLGLLFLSCRGVGERHREAIAKIDLKRGDLKLCGSGQFGEVNFTLGCDPNTAEAFNLALSLLHSFEYTEAEKAFVQVIDQDPGCAMAYWGVAMSNFHPLWAPPSREELQKGSQILEIAKGINSPENVRDYLDAIGAFYTDWEHTDHASRTGNFEAAMARLHQKYKDDKEAAVFYALALNASANPTDKSYTNQRKAGKLLESLFPEQPDHPGIAHYIIHNYDYPELAAMALPTARKYASIAPASAHAQHMPSHIFTRLGLWDESIQSNLNSTASALCYAESIDKDAHWDEEIHGMDYLVYAYLQVGDNTNATAQYDYLRSFKKIFPVNFKVAYTAAAIPARIALENRDWQTAASLELPLSELIPWEDYPWQRSILNFARAMGSIRLGDIATAEEELAVLNANRETLLSLGEAYQANQVAIQIMTIQAWIQNGKGDTEEALKRMSMAVEMENQTTKHPVTPGEVLPAGELLGDLLLEMGLYEEALQAFEADLNLHPNRFNGIYGAALAARQTGNSEKAKTYYRKLLDITKNVNSTRKELLEASTYAKTMAVAGS